MKLNGRVLKGPNEELIIIPRGNGDDIVLRARAIMDWATFETICPIPMPPKIMLRDGSFKFETTDPGYLTHRSEYSSKKMNWMIIKSLQATVGLEWDKVNIDDPNTWNLVQDELKDAGFSEAEIRRIGDGVMAANSLDDDKLEEARRRFTLAQAQEVVAT